LADSFTQDIAVGIAENIFWLTKKKEPYVVIANYHRKYIDANRSKTSAYEVPHAKKFYNEYHTKIARFIRKIRVGNIYGNGLGFIFDIHGTAGISVAVAQTLLDFKLFAEINNNSSIKNDTPVDNVIVEFVSPKECILVR
jgi:hypothetical protein